MKIPIVFAFDDNYALLASVAIRSLVETKSASADYEIIVLHAGLSEDVRARIETIAKIKWVKIESEQFKSFPVGWTSEATWYRLMMAEVLPDYDKVLWSDVDVLFRRDLGQVFKIDLGECDWAGVKMAQNPDEFAAGFMVVNTKRWRASNLYKRAIEFVKENGANLKMLDQDALNHVANKIVPIGPEYCVLERLLDRNNSESEYSSMYAVHGAGLDEAIKNPAIIHYSGPKVKVHKRPLSVMPHEFREAIVKSPFYVDCPCEVENNK